LHIGLVHHLYAALRAHHIYHLDQHYVNQGGEIIIVDDGNNDATWEQIGFLSQTKKSVVGLRLGRNFGQHSALLAGVRKAKYSQIVTIDDDLQNPPEEIPNLLAKLVNGVDVVYGVSTQVRQNAHH
jgi:undecaprenyl-phosphate 4-deoxy-4-formamido-L-arabinose transferase